MNDGVFQLISSSRRTLIPALLSACLVLPALRLQGAALQDAGQSAGVPKQSQDEPGVRYQKSEKKPADGSQVKAPADVVVVSAARMEIPLEETPAATSVVSVEALRAMPREVAADEALKLVPGIKVDNQADGERVHVSIRGQGLLTERGVRGIKILLDGLPLNDPTGFAPDLFDVDWSTVDRIEVFRGPASALYGGGSAGGVINITTREGSERPIGGNASLTGGSHGFWKGFSEAGGTKGRLNYRVSASHNAGDGYRDHTAFHATNLYGKFRWSLGPAAHITAILAGTGFFNENAEGLNIDWLRQDRRMANPDALAFNEYQRTKRVTTGLSGLVNLTADQDLKFSVYYRHTRWQESVPSSVQHRFFDTPGGIIQYTLHSGHGLIRNHFTAGSDLDWQTINQYRYPNLGLAVEGPDKLSQDDIYQRGVGLYFLDRIEFGPAWSLMFDVRSDHIHNKLTDQLKAGGVDLSGKADFTKATGRVGLAWNPDSRFGLYTSWGQGFLPPATEELANNPDHLGGFNMSLVPATSHGEEVGARGRLGNRLFYDAAFFHLATQNDFERYRVPSRPLETFYRNAGSSRRYGIETSTSWYPLDPLVVRLAYTFSHFKYNEVHSLVGDFRNTFMPNEPRHRAYLDFEYTWRSRIIAGLGVEAQSRAYVDATNLAWAPGYTLVHPRIGFHWGRSDRLHGEFTLSARNLFGTEYIAFTEPDPDGNSYQPGPEREVFLGARIFLGGQ